MVDFGVLGPLRVIVGRVDVDLRAPKLATLLAGLLIRANEPVGIDYLADVLWDEADLPANPRATIQTYISRLRLLVGDAVLRTTADRYRLVVPDDHCDLTRFRALVASGRAAEGESRHADAVEALVEGLGLWRGEAFAGVASSALLRHAIAAVDDERLAAREQLAALRTMLGDHDAAIRDLRELTRSNPLRERSAELLMRALHEAGRRADALTEYERVRTLHREELGLEPTATLRELHVAILSDDAPAARTPRSVPRQLPAQARRFTGREAELRVLVDLLDTEPVVAIEGTAGVGKTALALRFAHSIAPRFPGGSAYLDLRGFGPGEPVDPSVALTALLRSVGVTGRQVPDDIAERSALWRTHTAGLRMVVLLDNARDSGQVRPLLPGPGCLTVTTTRTGLTGLGARDGAHRMRLNRLPLRDAVALFAGIVGEDRATAEPEATERLVERAARLPLAIRVLAERARTEPDLTGLLAELDSGLSAFSTPDDLDTDLRTVLSYSYTALSPAAARLFRLLALHPGDDFDAAATSALADVPDAEPLLRELAAAHLVERRDGRFLMHDLLRAYAHSLCPTENGAVRRLLDWYLGGALRAGAMLLPHRAQHLTKVTITSGPVFTSSATALAWCTTESRTLDAATRLAYRVGEDRHAWQLPWAMLSYLLTQNRVRDGLALYDVALAAARRLDDRAAEAWVLNCMGFLVSFVDEKHTLEINKQALAIRMDLPDRKLQGESLLNVALAYNRLGDHQDAYEHCTAALSIAQSNVDRYAELACLAYLANIEVSLGRYSDALDHLRQSAAILDPLPDPNHHGLRLTYFGLATAGLGHHDEAAAWLEEAVGVFADIGDRYAEAGRLVLLADLRRRTGSRETAVGHLHRALQLFRELVGQGDLDDGDPKQLYDQALAMFGPSGETDDRAELYRAATAER